MASGTAAYYDANTKRFLRFGRGAASRAIHRAVWAPGIMTRMEAMRFVDDLVLAELADLTMGASDSDPDDSQAATVVDLGCGVGGSIAHLEQHIGGVYYGVTNSPVQQRIAATEASRRGSNSAFCVDDYNDPDLYQRRLPNGTVDLVYMIESFVHTADPQIVLDGVAKLLRRGGRLVICDDTLENPDAADTDVVRAFRRGWHAHSLLTVNRVAELARAAGLRVREDRDLTQYVELRRPRDRVIRLIAPLFPRLGLKGPFWDNMYGGNALQKGLLSGLIQYRYMVFEVPSNSSESDGVGPASSIAPFRK
ncbi:MAG: class I SAM-dependent methyltransferase [Spirochaetota bacterium]